MSFTPELDSWVFSMLHQIELTLAKMACKQLVRGGAYQTSYLYCSFITTDDSCTPRLLCIICGDQLANQTSPPRAITDLILSGPPGQKCWGPLF